MDPLYDLRAEMPQAEFDAVDYFVNEPGRSPAPPPSLTLYLDLDLSQPALADRLAPLLGDVAATAPGLRPAAAGWALTGEPPAGTDAWAGDTLDRVAAVLRTGRVEMFQVSFVDGDRRLDLALDALPDDQTAGLGLSVAASSDVWPPDTAVALLDLVARQRDLRTAAITWDRAGLHQSPWELWYSTPLTQVLPATRDHVRGYYWAILLTAGHLATGSGSFTVEHYWLTDHIGQIALGRGWPSSWSCAAGIRGVS
jgi:hypothetical protein